MSSWFLCGLVTTILSFTFGLHLPVEFLLLLPIGVLILMSVKFMQKSARGDYWQKILMVLLVLVWLSHLIQVFVPETGFDALWYHLPLVDNYLKAGKLTYSPDLYQSLNPQFSDLIFLLGYKVIGELGTKLVAYCFSLTLLVTSYLIAKKFLVERFVLVFALIISLLQVIAWQSASFYVDIAKATWELAAIHYLLAEDNLKKWQILPISALLFGASLATKLFSLLLFPFFVLSVAKKENLKSALLFILLSFLIALPFYLFSYNYSGKFFYSADHHLSSMVGDERQITLYLFLRLINLPTSILVLLQNRDYLNPVLFVFLPLVIFNFRQLSRTLEQKFLLIFIVFQWLIYWFVPPISTRYALSGFIILFLFLMMSLAEFSKKSHFNQKLVATVITIAVIWGILPRIYVNQRSLVYLLGEENKQTYLQQFYDGNIDRVLNEWHQLK